MCLVDTQCVCVCMFRFNIITSHYNNIIFFNNRYFSYWPSSSFVCCYIMRCLSAAAFLNFVFVFGSLNYSTGLCKKKKNTSKGLTKKRKQNIYTKEKFIMTCGTNGQVIYYKHINKHMSIWPTNTHKSHRQTT